MTPETTTYHSELTKHVFGSWRLPAQIHPQASQGGPQLGIMEYRPHAALTLYAYITNGAGLRPQAFGPARDYRCELFLFTRNDGAWVIPALFQLAHYPSQMRTLLGDFDIIHIGRSIHTVSRFDALMIVPPSSSRYPGLEWATIVGHRVSFRQLIGVYEQEIPAIERMGKGAFWERVCADSDAPLDVARPLVD